MALTVPKTLDCRTGLEVNLTFEILKKILTMLHRNAVLHQLSFWDPSESSTDSSGLSGREAGVCGGGSEADRWGRGTHRGTRHPSVPASLPSLTSACRSDQALSQTSISLPLWMVRGLGTCSIKLSKVPSLPGLLQFSVSMWMGIWGAINSGTSAVPATLKEWGNSEAGGDAQGNVHPVTFSVEQNCPFPF